MGSYISKTLYVTVADPGFPVGGRGPRREGVDLRGSYVTKILCLKTKESGPVAGRAPGTPPKSANVSKRKNLDPWGRVRNGLAYINCSQTVPRIWFDTQNHS